MKRFRIPPVLGLLGFLGFTGFFLNPLFCMFFGFFGFYFWGLIEKEAPDERLEQNIEKAMSIAGRIAVVLCFFILFALDKNISGQTVLLWGALGYAFIFILAPALCYIKDKRG